MANTLRLAESACVVSGNKVTLQDVARCAHVSRMTVSRVIRGFRNVSPAVRRRVDEAVKSLSYYPDPSLSALSAYRRRNAVSSFNTLAFLEMKNSSSDRHLFKGAQAEASLLGYHLERFMLGQSPEENREVHRILFHRGVHGLLLDPACEPENLKDWNLQTFSVVSLATTGSGVFHSVDFDYFQGSYMATRRFQKEGIKRIALILDGAVSGSIRCRWEAGYRAAMMESGESSTVYLAGKIGETKVARLLRSGENEAFLTTRGVLQGTNLHFEKKKTALRTSVIVLDGRFGSNIPWMSCESSALGAEGVRLLHQVLLKQEYGFPERPIAMALQSRVLSADHVLSQAA